MTISEIKDLTKFLSEEEVEKIKKEIKSKEEILKSGKLDEEEMIQVLNTLFAILVIEKTLESEIEGVEEIREELEAELLEAYNIYDSYMDKSKSEEKKKKKRRLLDFLFLSDNIHSKRESIGASKKTINALQKELNDLKQQRSDQNLRDIVNKHDHSKFDRFCEKPQECRNPRHNHSRDRHLNERMRGHREFERARAAMERAQRQAAREAAREIRDRLRGNGGESSRNNIDMARSNQGLRPRPENVRR